MIDITTVRSENEIVAAFAAKFPKLGTEAVKDVFKAEIHALCAAWRKYQDSCLRDMRPAFALAREGVVGVNSFARGTRRRGGVGGGL